MSRQKPKKKANWLYRFLGLVGTRHTGKLIDAKHTSYGALFIILLLFFPRLGLPKALLGLQTSSGNVQVSLTVPGPPPTTKPTIVTPIAGTYSDRLMTIAGTCTTDLLVKVFSNDVFVGSSYCDTNGQFTLQASLFWDTNVLKAVHYDTLDQAGPDSDTVTVSIIQPQPAAPSPTPGTTQTGDNSNTPPTVNSVSFPIIQVDYSYRNVNPGASSSWTFNISSGTPPYSLYIDWGDGTHDTGTLAQIGPATLSHIYKKPGDYVLRLTVTDNLGVVSLIQLGVTVNGTIPVSKTSPNNVTSTNGATPICNNSWGLLNGSCQNNSTMNYLLVPIYWVVFSSVAILGLSKLLVPISSIWLHHH